MIVAPKRSYAEVKDGELVRGVSVLEFPPESSAPSGRYYMRGGICWPDYSQPGYAVIVGRHLATSVLWVLDERRFAVVDHILRDDGGIEYEGIAPWVVGMWSRYYCDHYYDHQHGETRRKYLLQVLRSPAIQPKPHFAEVEWDDPGQPLHSIHEADALGRLKYRASGELFAAMQQHAADNEIIPPALHAAMCAVAGHERSQPRGMK